MTAVRRSSVGGAPEGMAVIFVMACRPGPWSPWVDVGWWHFAQDCWKIAAPRASWGVHSEAGLEGGRDLHPDRLTGAAQASKAKRRLRNRIGISALMIQAGGGW